MAPPRIGVIIPAYQTSRTVADVVRHCIVQEEVREVVVVDDGSSDETAAAARAAGAVVRVHSENRGKGAALLTGFGVACQEGWDAAVTIDADGQHDPAEIPRFVSRFLATGADVIIGARKRSGTRMPLQRRMSNRLSSLLVTRLAGAHVADSQSGYRLVSRRVWEQLTLSRSRYDMESELLIKAGRAGLSIDAVDITTVYGDERSHFRPWSDTWRMVRLFVTMYLLEEEKEAGVGGRSEAPAPARPRSQASWRRGDQNA